MKSFTVKTMNDLSISNSNSFKGPLHMHTQEHEISVCVPQTSIVLKTASAGDIRFFPKPQRAPSLKKKKGGGP